MTVVAFTIEQLRAAPPDVRRWAETELGRALSELAGQASPAHPAGEGDGDRFAACSAEEMAQVFERIRGDFLSCQVFFELGREAPGAAEGNPFHVVRLADLLRHAHLAEVQHLIACLDAITLALRQVRNDPAATMFGFDRQGHCYLSAATHRAIRAVWQAYLAGEARGERAARAEPVAAPPA